MCKFFFSIFVYNVPTAFPDLEKRLFFCYHRKNSEHIFSICFWKGMEKENGES